MNTKNKVKPIFSRPNVNHRFEYLVVVFVSVAALFAAWYLQNVRDLAPCPLCIMQRYGFFVLGIFALVGLIKGNLNKFTNAIAMLVGFCAAGVSGYHNWLLLQPKFECGMDPVQNIVNELPMARWWPDMFMATGMCSTKLPLLYGISIPFWSLICLISLFSIFAWRWVRS